jgi:dynein heavy chain, axonemal
MEPYKPIPGRVPRKVEIDRKKKEYKGYDVEDLLLNEGVDVNNVAEHVKWLDLELFDDKTFDDYTPKEWLEKAMD